MHVVESRLLVVLTGYVSDIVAKSILQLSVERSHVDFDRLEAGTREKLLTELKKGLAVFIQEVEVRARCAEAMEQALNGVQGKPQKSEQRATVEVSQDSDVVLARSKGWYLCQQMDFPSTLKASVTTAITELARNIVQYAGKGKVELRGVPGDPPFIEIIASDSGPGIPDVASILAGRYKSSSGLGLGLKGVKQIMDEFDIRTAPGRGTTVTARKYLR
jgi:serine/threonine-protein kinase RsbT